MAERCIRCKVELWSYCQMPNYVHLITVPESEDGLRRAIGEAHHRYTRYINFREGWKGHLVPERKVRSGTILDFRLRILD